MIRLPFVESPVLEYAHVGGGDSVKRLKSILDGKGGVRVKGDRPALKGGTVGEMRFTGLAQGPTDHIHGFQATFGLALRVGLEIG